MMIRMDLEVLWKIQICEIKDKDVASVMLSSRSVTHYTGCTLNYESIH